MIYIEQWTVDTVIHMDMVIHMDTVTVSHMAMMRRIDSLSWQLTW